MFVGCQPRAAPGYDVTDGGDDDTKIVLEIVLVFTNKQHQDLGEHLIILQGLRWPHFTQIFKIFA